MLDDYKKEKRITLDVNAAAGKLHYLTSGPPFLVSKLCRIIDDKLTPGRGDLYAEAPLERASTTGSHGNRETCIKKNENSYTIKLSWEEGNLEIALNILLKEKNTNFDSVVKNLVTSDVKTVGIQVNASRKIKI